MEELSPLQRSDDLMALQALVTDTTQYIGGAYLLDTS